MALARTLSTTSQPKQMIVLNHVDLITLFQMTTQHLQANVLNGANRMVLVNGIKSRRPLIVC